MTAQEGEPVARLIEQYQGRLYAYIRSLVPHPVDAEEVLQEATLFIWKHADEYAPNTDFGAWAYKIAYYHVLSFRKRETRRRAVFSDAMVDKLALDAAVIADQADRRLAALERCMQKLDPQERDVIRRKYGCEATVPAMAEQMGCSVATLYRMLNRIHVRLMACVQRALELEKS